MDWISIKEKLPPIMKDVLIAAIPIGFENDKGIHVFTGYLRFQPYDHDKKWVINCMCEDREGVEEFEVIYWMPLPELPKI